MLQYISTIFVVLFISSSLSNCAMIKEDDTLSPSATVFLYSGRPNPKWKLSLNEWIELNQLIGTLPKLTEDAIGPYQFEGQLGYSGFYAHLIISSSYPDIYYVAQNQQVVLSNPGGHMIYNDQKKIIEKWFKDCANRHGIPLPI